MAIPWMQLVKLAPTIVSVTKELRQHVRKGESLSHPQSEPQMGYFDAGRDRRTEALQGDLIKQAEALHTLAQQLEGVTAAVGSLRKTLHTAIALGTCALFSAVVALIVAVVR